MAGNAKYSLCKKSRACQCPSVNAFKLAFGVAGGQGGRGIAMIHNDDGSWSNPFFVNLGEGSLGLQIGAQASDIVLLFKHKSDILEILQPSLNILWI